MGLARNIGTWNVDPNLSDLFFNYSHDESHKIWNNEDHTDEEYRNAVVSEAKEFIDAYENLLNCQIPSDQDLADDFIRRL